MIALLTALNSVSPLGVIVLLSLIIYKGIKFTGDAEKKYKVLTENHLHELPEMAATLSKIADILQRIEVSQATIIAKLP